MSREFLSGYFPNKSYRTLYNWQKGKINPQAMGELVEAATVFTKQYIPNPQDMTAEELFKEFLSEKEKLTRRVRKKVKSLSNSALHHKMNLDPDTISRLRKARDVPFVTLKRLDEIPTQADRH
jgi:hypothetical protein